MIFHTDSPEETEALGARLAEKLDTGAAVHPFIALFGEMGVGKTAFVRGFSSHFGVHSVKSPTYTIVNEYRGRMPIYHFDTYRITDGDDLASTGFDDYVNGNGFLLCEWAENISGFLPENTISVKISRSDEKNGRTVEITGWEGTL